MPLQRISMAEFLGCLIDCIEDRTGLRCYDDPSDQASPFFAVQLTSTEPADTKTMFIDSFDVAIHCISEPRSPYSTAPVLKLIQKLEEALTESIELPYPFQVNDQRGLGLQSLKKDETNEGHAVLGYRFDITYGFKIK